MYCFKGTSKGANTFDVGSHFETSLSACRLDLEPPGPGHRAELGRGLLGGAADPRGEEDLQRPQGGTRGRATAQWGSGPLVFDLYLIFLFDCLWFVPLLLCLLVVSVAGFGAFFLLLSRHAFGCPFKRVLGQTLLDACQMSSISQGYVKQGPVTKSLYAGVPWVLG